MSFLNDIRAQNYSYHPFNMDSAVWYIQTIHQNNQIWPPYPTYSYERYFFDSDTLINNTNYKKLYVDFTNTYGNPNGINGFYVIRQDTIQRKLIQLQGQIINNDTLSWESVKYDFNWQIGDTVNGDGNSPSVDAYITDIDSFYIYGKYRKRFTYSYQNGTHFNFIYDGLGFNFGFSNPVYYEEAGYFRNLFCYSDNAPNHFIDSCQNVVYLSVNKIETNRNNKLVINNIVDNTLELNSITQCFKIEITALNGEVITYPPTTKNISTINFSNGIYILKVFENNQKFKTQKFIINH
jgi:hypothetical protein